MRKLSGGWSATELFWTVRRPSQRIWQVNSAQEFMSEIFSELMHEIGVGFVVSAIPIIGGFAAIGLDAALAATMTWRVGTMVSIYYQNGQRWVKDRHSTYEIGKGLVGGLSPIIAERFDLNSIRNRVPEVNETQVRELLRFVWKLHDRVSKKGFTLEDDDIRDSFKDQKIPKDLLDEVIRRFRRGDGKAC